MLILFDVYVWFNEDWMGKDKEYILRGFREKWRGRVITPF